MGRYLGPAIDVGSAMTYKILKPSGDYVCRSTVRQLTPYELRCPVTARLKEEFTAEVNANLGLSASVSDFPESDLTPDCEYYGDQEEEFEGTPDEVLPPTPEVGDNYVGADLMLPRGQGVARCRVVKRSRDNDGQPIGRANDNLILDTREYVVEFEDGEQAELAANAIAQSMYAQV